MADEPTDPSATDDAPTPKRKKRSAADLAAFLKTARDRFEQATTADRQQRERELDDLRFYAGDQWPEAIKQARSGQPAEGTLPPTPARPCFVINKVREPVHQVQNAERQADFGIELVAADDFGELAPVSDDQEVKLREGLVRRIQRASEAADARTWAFARATIAGRGFYGVMTRWVPGKSRDQELFVQRFYNQASVSLDPAHEQPDGSDAGWGFQGNDFPWDEYCAEFPELIDADGNRKKNTITDYGDNEFRALGDDYPNWFTSEGDSRSARVVDYWYTVRTPRALLHLTDGTAEWKDEFDGDASTIELERDVVQQTIKWAKIDGYQILEETDWEGPDLPIVKVLGEELQPYDKERRAEGMVRPARDAQQGFNAMVSKWVETVGYTPIPPPRVAVGQIEGYEKWYQAATTRVLPYLPYMTEDSLGHEVGAPTRDWGEMPIQAIGGSVALFDAAIKSTTGVPDPNLGKQSPQVKSGVMAQALIAQSQHGTSNYLDNLQRSLRYEGQIINNLLYPIYGKRPGRIARIIDQEGESQTVVINGPPQPTGGVNAGPSSPVQSGMALPPQPGGPLPGPPGMVSPGPQSSSGGPSAMGAMGAQPGASPQSPAPKKPKNYTLSKDANYHVIVKVTRAFTSRREQEVSIIADLLSANPALMTWFGDLFFKNQDGPGHDQMAERAKAMLDPKIQMMLDQAEQGSGGASPQAMAQIAALQKQLQAAHGVISAAQQDIQSKQTEWDSRMKIAQMEIDAKDRQAALDRDAKIAVSENAAKVDRVQLNLDALSQLSAQRHEMAMGAANASHDLKKLRITKTLQRGPDGAIIGATEDHQQVPADNGQPDASAPASPDQGAPQ